MASPPIMKRMIPQLILSISIFSFVFSYSSLYSSLSSSPLAYSPNNFKFHYSFSSNSIPLLSKNCLFLICNGLLVFLAKTSGLVRPPPELASSDLSDILQKRIADDLQMSLDQNVLPEESTAARDQLKEDEKRLDDESNLSTERFSEEVSIMIGESEEEGTGEKDEDRGIRSCWLFDEDAEQLYEQEVEEEQDEDEDEDEEEEEEKEELSTQELNQKFEDFIRRMKEEIMINEARQKVVVRA